jgi:hypothetical protein
MPYAVLMVLLIIITAMQTTLQHHIGVQHLVTRNLVSGEVGRLHQSTGVQLHSSLGSANATNAAVSTGEGRTISPPSRSRGGVDGGSDPILSRLHSNAGVRATYPLAHRGVDRDDELSAQQIKQLRRRYQGRKFLFPLLDQGPNNQFLQFRVALARARTLNRTLVLPIWLPHNPKFMHYHPGAPSYPTRDKKLDQAWYSFETAFDPDSIREFVRTVSLRDFRVISGGRLDRCEAAHTTGFESYLRLAAMTCKSFSKKSVQPLVHAHERFLGFHEYDYDLGTRERYFAYVRPSRAVTEHDAALRAELFSGDPYLAAHVRVADAHWEHSDCKHKINGHAVDSVSCGDGKHVINSTSLAHEIVSALSLARVASKKPLSARVRVFLATNMNCSDSRVVSMTLALRAQQVTLVCAQAEVLAQVSNDHFMASLVEQEVCTNADGFVGSKYSTWTDTVRGRRAHVRPMATYSFEGLWADGIT